MANRDVPLLFQPLHLRELTLRNRIGMSPMCQYSASDGVAGDWHVQHLVSRAVGGVGLVIVEATAVLPEGRISPGDLGLWSDDHVAGLRRIVDGVHAAGAAIGIQLAHAGRKACVQRPWHGGAPLAAGDDEYWRIVAPSALPYDARSQVPHELAADEIAGVVAAFAEAARRAEAAGFDLVEVHAAHGYLLHEFLSPLSNRRQDSWGGSVASRAGLPLEVVRAVRAAWPDDRPMSVRVSVTDHMPDGWTLDDALTLAPQLRDAGADIIDCSSGGLHPEQQLPAATGLDFQVEYARAVRAAGVATAAVGSVTSATQAEGYLHQGDCDIVLLGRELLRNPYWAQQAARELGFDPVAAGLVPPQYLRGAPQQPPRA